MKEFIILLSPVYWALKNDVLRFSRSFYKKMFFYALSGAALILIVMKLLIFGMDRLKYLSPEVFNIMLVKGYSLIFIIIFFIQIINGLLISFNTYYQARDLEVLFTSPVSRMSLFFSRLLETHLKTSWMLIIFGIPLLASSGRLFNAGFIYYFYSLALLFFFSIIPVNLGVGITILLSGVFNIAKLKKIALSAGIIAAVAMVTLLRLFRPERFVNPELFANLKIFLVELNTPSFILLPNRWLSEAIFSFLNKNYSDTFIFVSLLLLSPYITVIFLALIYKKYHYKGWSILQGGNIISKEKTGHGSYFVSLTKKIISSKPVQLLLPSFDNQGITLFRKDLVCQFRDLKNVQQNLILFSLIIVYLFSIASLPLNWEVYAVKLKYIISFFNLGLILIIIAALCSKLVYPAIVSEGNFLWIIKTAPITPKKYIRTKFFFLFIPIFILGQMLTVFSSLFIDVGTSLFALNIATTALICFLLVSLAIAFSISDLTNTLKGTKSDEIETGNVTYMVISVVFILLTMALEAIPVYLNYLRESEKVVFMQKAWFIIGGAIGLLSVISVLMTALLLRRSVKRFDNVQLI